jgi:DNA-binding NtrC family response regulator
VKVRLEKSSGGFRRRLAESSLARPQRATVTRFDDCTLRLIGTTGHAKVRDLSARAPTDTTVLICGESGCGKEPGRVCSRHESAR